MPKAGPSLHTGAQTRKKGKAGSRVQGKNVFPGQGMMLNPDGHENSTGSGSGKRANSKRARAERLLAIEKRLAQSTASPTSATLEDESGTKLEGTSQEPSTLNEDDNLDASRARSSVRASTATSSRVEDGGDGNENVIAASANVNVSPGARPKRARDTGFRFGNIAQDEIDLRKKESLGMAHTQPPRRLGSSRSSVH